MVKTPLYRFIALTCGYVESARTSVLVFGSDFLSQSDGFTDRDEAIKELALDMYAKYQNDGQTARPKRDCCVKTSKVNAEASFCSTCGHRLSPEGFDEVRFMDLITNLHSSTADSYGDAEWSADRNLVWWPWCWEEFMKAPKYAILRIEENAEKILCAALYKAMPEIKPANTELVYFDKDDF